MQTNRGAAKHNFNQAAGAARHGRRYWRFYRRSGRTVMGDHRRRKGRGSLLEPGCLTFAKPIPPSEQLLRPKTMTASDSRNHDPVLAALRDDRQLLFAGPIPAAFNARDHFDPRPSRGLGFKSTVNLMVKSMDAHGRASCPHARQRGRWGQSIAYKEMAIEAERLVAGTGWLPAPLRGVQPKQQADEALASGEPADNSALPAFLDTEEMAA